MKNYQTTINLYTDFKKAQKEEKKHKHDYSLIHSMLSLNDEVRLHSRFIFSMINPDSLHYQKSQFLKEFLMLIPFAKHLVDNNKFDFANAKVELERDNIDLLIHDNHYFIIVENKLNAVDQTHQLSRYIKLIVERTHIQTAADINQRIGLVYLSKRKSKPTELVGEYARNYSLVGFLLNRSETQISWLNQATNLVNRDHKGKLTGKYTAFTLPDDTIINYHHLPYFNIHISTPRLSLKDWIMRCKSQEIHEDLKYAFSEYLKIIERLDTRHYKKNVMNLKDFYYQQNDRQKAQLFELLKDGEKHFTDIKIEDCYRAIVDYFTGLDIVASQGGFENVIENKENNSHLQHRFSRGTLKKWIMKDGKKDAWISVGFVLKAPDKSSPGVVFNLAEEFLYFGYFTDLHTCFSKDEIDIAGHKDITLHSFNQINIRNVIKSGNISALINDIDTKTKRLLLK